MFTVCIFCRDDEELDTVRASMLLVLEGASGQFTNLFVKTQECLQFCVNHAVEHI